MIEFDRSDAAEVDEPHVVDHRIDRPGGDDRVQHLGGSGAVGEVDLVELARKVVRSLRARPTGMLPASATRSATARPMPFDAPVISTRRGDMASSSLNGESSLLITTSDRD